jgi:hypothetical protein
MEPKGRSDRSVGARDWRAARAPYGGVRTIRVRNPERDADRGSILPRSGRHQRPARARPSPEGAGGERLTVPSRRRHQGEPARSAGDALLYAACGSRADWKSPTTRAPGVYAPHAKHHQRLVSARYRIGSWQVKCTPHWPYRIMRCASQRGVACTMSTRAGMARMSVSPRRPPSGLADRSISLERSPGRTPERDGGEPARTRCGTSAGG